jgi:hypothetical protein
MSDRIIDWPVNVIVKTPSGEAVCASIAALADITIATAVVASTQLIFEIDATETSGIILTNPQFDRYVSLLS